MRLKGAWTITSGTNQLVYSGGAENERSVGILFDQAMSKSLKGFWLLSDRVLLIKIEGKPFDIKIIQVYPPISASSDKEINAFYEDLEKLRRPVNHNSR